MSLATASRGGAVHWNGPPMGLINCNGRSCASRVEAIRNFHVRTRGWRDIAYNHLICPGCGTVYVGRGWGVQSAANGTTAANREWHAWMVLSGEGEPFTDRARLRLLELHAEHGRRYGRSRLTTHRAVRGGTTDCPGRAVRAWVAAGSPTPPLDPVIPTRPSEEDVMTPAQEAKLDKVLQLLEARNFADDNRRIRLSLRAVGRKLGIRTSVNGVEGEDVIA